MGAISWSRPSCQYTRPVDWFKVLIVRGAPTRGYPSAPLLLPLSKIAPDHPLTVL
jgi:hypothetical protein